MKRPPTRRALVVGVLLIAALAIRVAEVQRTAYRPINDAGSYLSLAGQISNSGDYPTGAVPGGGAGGTRGPSAYFAPGFPYFLAVVDLLDGHRGGGQGAVHPARLSQAVLGTIIVGLIGLVALEALGPAVGLIALALAAFYPVLIELSGTLVAENLLTALVLAAVYAGLRTHRSPRAYRWIAAAGILTGLATLTHVNAVVLLLPLALAARRARPGLRGPALLLATAALTIAPWTIRNAILLHRFIPVSDETGITLVGTYNRASAADRQVPYRWRLYSTIPGERRLIGKSGRMTEPGLGARLQSQALDYISDHPLAPLAVAYHNTLRLFELEGSFAWQVSAASIDLPRQTAQIGVISFWLLCALALAGAFARVARAAPRWLWAAPLLLWLSAAVINGETPRFREPVDPFLILLTACALAAVVVRLRALAGAPVDREAGAAVSARPAELV